MFEMRFTTPAHNLLRIRNFTLVELVNMTGITESTRDTLLLQVWEAINTERELPGVLRATEEALHPVVPFWSIAIVKLDLAHAANPHPLYALHIVGLPYREGEGLPEFIERVHQREVPPSHETRPLIPYPPLDADSWSSDEVYV
jgi:hypothetical protein